jgi:integrase
VNLPSRAFDLPGNLNRKADPSLIAGDEQHFAAIATSLENSIAELSDGLDVERRAPGGIGQAAMDRDVDIHRMASRLRTLRRFGLDLCLGHIVSTQDCEPVYIGRLGLADRAGRRLLLDWRSHAAEPFFGATHAYPMGLTSRRRYRWTRGRISDYWDEVFTVDAFASNAALDDQSAFIPSLGSNRSARMRDVLGTIQSDPQCCADRTAGPRRRVVHRPLRQRPRRTPADGRTPAASHAGLRHGQRERAAARDRAGPSAPQPLLDGQLRPRGRGSAARPRQALAEPDRGWPAMTDLAGHVQDYLRLRRALAFKLVFEGHALPQLVDYLTTAGASTVTADLVIAWAGLPQGVKPITLAHRLGAARGFAKYLQTIDPTAQVPPTGIWPAGQLRPTPYLRSQADIVRLLTAARELAPPLRAATIETLLGLLAVSGMRVGEALHLTREDVHLGAGVLRIREAKFDRERLVPLHQSTTARLRA